MFNVAVVVEGHTERSFVNGVVAPALGYKGVEIFGTLVGPPNRKQGGIRPWVVYRKELLDRAKERPNRHVAVLVDYYAMPECWPGRSVAPSKPKLDRGRFIEDALRNDLRAELGDRFHPCVQLHEYEALIFVNPKVAADVMVSACWSQDAAALEKQLVDIRTSAGGVEAINDSRETAPSKQLKGLVKGYNKVVFGYQVAKDVGLEDLMAGCPWLGRWVEGILGTTQKVTI